jgi:hypothetical protein
MHFYLINAFCSQLFHNSVHSVNRYCEQTMRNFLSLLVDIEGREEEEEREREREEAKVIILSLNKFMFKVNIFQ